MDARPTTGIPHAPSIWVVPECSCANSNSDTSVWSPVYTTTYGTKVAIPTNPPLTFNTSIALYPKLKTITASCYAKTELYLFSNTTIGLAFYDQNENLITDDYGQTYRQIGSVSSTAAGSGGTPYMATLSSGVTNGTWYQMSTPVTPYYAALVLKSLRGTYAVTMAEIILYRS